MESVVVVIAAPGSGAITAEIASQLKGVWLAEHEALDVDVSREDETRALCAGLPVDINIVPVANRRKRILLADMDSTMIEQECIDELGVVAGVGNHIKAITARAMRGDIDFEAALKERVGLLKGLPESVIQDVIDKHITFMPGGKILLATMKHHGAYTALVSGGFTAFTSYVAQALGFDEHRANILLVENQKLTGDVELPILGKNAKVESLQRICSVHGLTPFDVIAVGDGANDIPMLQTAGMGIALHAKSKVQEQAKFLVNHGDLTALLYLQGYKKAEFAL